MVSNRVSYESTRDVLIRVSPIRHRFIAPAVGTLGTVCHSQSDIAFTHQPQPDFAGSDHASPAQDIMHVNALVRSPETPCTPARHNHVRLPRVLLPHLAPGLYDFGGIRELRLECIHVVGGGGAIA